MADIREILTQATGFGWDAGDAAKVASRHGIEPGECEQAFLSEPFLISFDESRSQGEPRWQGLGRTTAGRLLFVVFTARRDLIRVIAARDMSRKERFRYAEIKERPAEDTGV